MKIVFFDTQATLPAKNFLALTDYCYSKLGSKFEAVFISTPLATISESNEKKSIKLIVEKPYASFIEITSFRPSDIRAQLEKIQPDYFFIDCFRMIDQLWLKIASGYCKETVMVQHGMEIETVNYNPFLILQKIKKIINYVKIGYHLSRELKINAFILIFRYFQKIYSGGKVYDRLVANPKLYPTVAFVYSDYYAEFYKNVKGFKNTIFKKNRYPDLDLADKVKVKPKQDAVCYISQSLLEDGRLTKKQYKELLEEYAELAKKVPKLIIKLHPRVEESSFDALKSYDNIEITRDFPHCSSYITHYSSMAFLPGYLGSRLVLHELKGHKTPDIFKKLTEEIVDSPLMVDFNDDLFHKSSLNSIIDYHRCDNSKIIFDFISENK